MGVERGGEGSAPGAAARAPEPSAHSTVGFRATCCPSREPRTGLPLLSSNAFPCETTAPILLYVSATRVRIAFIHRAHPPLSARPALRRALNNHPEPSRVVVLLVLRLSHHVHKSVTGRRAARSSDMWAKETCPCRRIFPTPPAVTTNMCTYDVSSRTYTNREMCRDHPTLQSQLCHWRWSGNRRRLRTRSAKDRGPRGPTTMFLMI